MPACACSLRCILPLVSMTRREVHSANPVGRRNIEVAMRSVERML